MALRDAIPKAVRARETNIVEFTTKLVSVATENPPGCLYEECVEIITDELRLVGIDFEVVHIPSEDVSGNDESYPRFAVIARYGSDEPVLHFHGHYDVVPAEDRALFKPEIRGGQIHGRGSSDMKSGLAAMIYAVEALRTCEVDLEGSVNIAIVPDEETGGALGSRYLTEAGLIGQSGIGMLTAEPTSGAVWYANRGAISLLIKVKGVPMHVGLQHEGVNAFDNMLLVANSLTQLKREVETRTTEFNVRPDSARRSILMLGGRCVGGTNFNLVPGECSFTVDRRINPEEDLDTEKRRILDLLDDVRNSGVNLDVEVLQEEGSAGVSENTEIARALAQSVEQITGRCPPFEMCPGLLEIRFYAANGIPAFAYGPGILSVSHGPNEFVPIKNILDCTAIYALTACDVLAV
jgi:acetylornithine deacetylase/succinyl-diaminopimelate desuccinylase family protein